MDDQRVELAGGEIPQPRGGVDIRTLPIGPEDAFVLSRIDGRTSVREIEITTGLSNGRVRQAILTLVQLGAVAPFANLIPGSSGATASQATTAPQPASVARNRTSTSAHSLPLSSPRSATSTSRPVTSKPATSQLRRDALASLDEALTRARTQDYYHMLGVARDADKKEIKAAYFRLVSDYHPDTYYGQQLGDAKNKLEQLFQLLTLAHETLTRTKKRQAYDATLGPPLPPPEGVPQTSAPSPHQERHAAQKPDQPESRRSHVSPRMSTAPATQRSPSRANVTQPIPTPVVPRVPIDRDVSRQPGPRASVAHHLKGLLDRAGPRSRTTKDSTLNPTPTSDSSVGAERTPQRSAVPPLPGTPPPRAASPHRLPTQGVASSAPHTSPLAVAPAPKTASPRPVSLGAAPFAPSPSAPSSAHATPSRSLSSQVHRYVVHAETQLADNPVAAANALRIALTLAPEDDMLKARLAEAEQRSDERLANDHLASAKVHARSNNWKAAGKYYAKAARGRQSGELYVLAAQCFRKDTDGLRIAGEQARKAIELDPHDVDAHVVLAEIYAEAGMLQSAIKVLETAAGLQPSDDAIQMRLTKLKRGEL